MQEIIDLYIRLYEAMGGRMKQSKILFYCWKWIYKNREKVIIEIEVELIVYREKIQQINVYESTIILIVHLAPALN